MSEQPVPLSGSEQSVLLHAETVSVGRRVRVTGTVDVAVVTETRDEPVDAMLTRTDVVVERVPFGHFVDEAPPVRRDGDCLIVPVLEEVVVTRLRLVEEVRVTSVASRRHHHELVPLRREAASVTRSPEPPIPSTHQESAE